MSEHGPALWAVVGATGTGKTALSLDLAQKIMATNPKRQPQIINADAMQFYKGLNIGTAKLPEAERRGIKHHLFDALEVTEEATVAWYQPTARALAQESLNAGNDVILVGGSGLYVSSVIYDFDFPPRDEELRASLQALFDREGVDPLLQRLRIIAPESAATVDINNPRRVIRALEVAELGLSAPTNLPTEPKLWQPNTRIINVTVDRASLVERLNARVESMWADGLLEEVAQLIEQGIEEGPTASRAIGYTQAIAQLRGDLTEAEAIEATQALTRKYARRQVSWFKRYPEMTIIDGLNEGVGEINL